MRFQIGNVLAFIKKYPFVKKNVKMNPSKFAKTRLKNNAKMCPKKFAKKLRLALVQDKM